MNDMLILYPNPILGQVAQPIHEITPDIQQRIFNMFPIMYEYGGIGLAAPQVGWSVRIFIVGNKDDPTSEVAFINPTIFPAESTKEIEVDEGCLSLPGISGRVTRLNKIVLRAQTLRKDTGELSPTHITSECSGVLAQTVQHEMDHLSGILLFNRFSNVRKQAIKSKLSKLEKLHLMQQQLIKQNARG